MSRAAFPEYKSIRTHHPEKEPNVSREQGEYALNAWPAIACFICASVLQANGESQPEAREFYKRAAVALLSKNVTMASVELGQLVEKYPDDPLAPLAALRLAECQLSQGNPKTAIETLEKWIPKFAESPKTLLIEPACALRAHLVLARAHLAADNLKEAIEIGTLQCELYSQRNDLPQLERGLLEQLNAVIKQAAKNQDHRQAVHLRTAAELVRKKSFNDALSALNKCDLGSLGPSWQWRYHVLKAQCLQGNGDASGSLLELDKIAQRSLNPSERIAVRMACLDSALGSGQIKRAQTELTELEKAVEGDQQLGPTIALRAVEVATLSKNRDEARKKAQAARKAYPNYASLHEFDLLLARNAIANIEFDEARKILRSVIDSAPGGDDTAVPRAQWLLGESYFLSRQYTQAIAAYTSAIDGNHSVTTELALMQRGKCFELQGDFVSASADYQRLLREYSQSRQSALATSRLAEIDSFVRSAAANSIPSKASNR